MGNIQVMIYCSLLPLLVKIDGATSEVNMANYSQGIAENSFTTIDGATT